MFDFNALNEAVVSGVYESFDLAGDALYEAFAWGIFLFSIFVAIWFIVSIFFELFSFLKKKFFSKEVTE